MSAIRTFMLLSFMVLGASAMGGTKDAPSAVVRSFHEALASGNRERVLELLDPDVVIFEQGGAEMSRDEYASHHLGEDIEFSRSTSRKLVSQTSGDKGASAWVLSISETSGTFGGKDVASRTAETMLLKQKSGEWRIAHIHWSSRRKEAPKP